MIRVDKVSYAYPAAKGDAIKDISFSVAKGEIFGFLGPSGAGKSTLQRILTGTLQGYRGGVAVLGREVAERTASFYEDIGVDFEFPNFYGKFTAMENLRYFSSLYKKAAIDPNTLLERVGLAADAHKRVTGFSKGMKMRLSFVRCLLHDPALLFLDEPTSGLDPANARILKDMIVEQKKRGKTVIITTHNMHDAEELCDRVAFIIDGRVEALDTPRRLRASGGSVATVRYFVREEAAERVAPLAHLADDAAFRDALQGGKLVSIHTQEPTLEDVFIRLTGRGLQ